MNTAKRDLIHRELDGENSPEESRRLQSLLADSGEARKLFEELSAVDRRLRESEMADPPPWLKRTVMDALPAQGRSAAQSRSAGIGEYLRNLWDSMQARPALAYAYTFVIGLAAGLALFAVALQDAPSPEGELYGTLADRQALERLSEDGTTPIQLPGFEGEIALLTSRELLAVDLDVQAAEQTEVRLVPELPLTLRGFTRRGGGGPIGVEENAVVLAVEGAQHVSLLFDRPAEDPSDVRPEDRMEVRLEIRREGRLIHEERLLTE